MPVLDTFLRQIAFGKWFERIDSVLPAWAREERSDILARARLLVVAVSIGAVIATLSAAFHAYHGAVVRSLFSLACALTMNGSLWLLRLSPRLQPVTHAYLSMLLIATVASPYLSQTDFTVPIGAVLVPFLASILVGLVPAVIWTAITLSVLTVSVALVSGDPAASHAAMSTWIVAAVCGVGSCLFEIARLSASQDADEASLRAKTTEKEREQAAAELHTTQALLAHSFREAPSLLILSNLETRKIVDVNNSFERISGWTPDEARGKTLTELNAWITPEDPQKLAQVILSDGRTKNVEIQLRTKSGGTIWMLAAASILQLEGAAHVLAQGIDITDRKIVEEELAKYRKLLESRVDERSDQLRESRVALRQQQQLATIGTLAAGIAHQINNPIGSIMAAAEFALLEDRDSGAGQSVQNEALRNVVAEAERCGKIVRNVLRFARQEPTARWIEDINPLVRRAAELASAYVTENGGRVTTEFESAACLARVSPIEVEQVLINLMRNAAEAFVSDGELRVSTRLRGDLVEIDITDNGRGMEAEQLARAFDPFFTTRINEGGTGLGLSFAHGVVVDHGGELILDSTPAKGTRVTIRLPRASEDTPQIAESD